MGKFKASKLIVKESWNVLMQDKEMMWFPILSAVFSLVLTLIFFVLVFFYMIGGALSNAGDLANGDTNILWYVLFVLYYLLSFFIVNFFQSAIFITANARFNGQNFTFWQSINECIKNVNKIFLWSLISTTVGLVLDFISRRSRILGQIVAGILGAAWSIMTYFSLPSLVVGGMSVKDSFKESASLIRKTWGEAIIINLGAGLFFGLIMIVLIFGVVGLGLLLPKLFFPLVILYVFAMIVLFIVSSTLNSIFKQAIYHYTKTGSVPQGFSQEVVANAIVSK